MANKRMFNNSVLDSDAFLDLPLSTQALYFHLNLRADDDGFISNPKRIQSYIGASEDDLKLLVLKSFVIAFDDGVIVIKHWRMHNTIQKDRYHPTNFQEDLKMLGLKENKAYTLDVSKMETECIQNVSSDLGLGLDKDLDIDLDKDLDKSKKKKKEAKPPVEYYPNDSILNDAFSDYVKMRKQIKAPMTDRAIEIAKNKLATLSDGNNDKAVAILEQSIMNSWKGLFDLAKPQGRPAQAERDVVDEWLNA